MSWRTTPEFKAKLDRAVAATGRSLMQEIELRLTWSIEGDDKLGGPRTAALLRHLAALVEQPGEEWLRDPDLYFPVINKWIEQLEATAPRRSPADEADIQAEFAAIKQGAEEGATPEERHRFRLIARRLAREGDTLSPAMRAAYAALGAEKAEAGIGQ